MPIKTIHGCTCKDEFMIGKYKIKDQCAYGGNDGAGGKKGTCPPVTDPKKLSKDCIRDADRPRCIIKEQGKCGYRGVEWGGVLDKDEYWDFCTFSEKNALKAENEKYTEVGLQSPFRTFCGFIIFIAIFVFAIPTVIYKKKSNTVSFLLFWLTNITWFAASIAYRNGFFNTRLFSWITDPEPTNIYTKITKFILQTISLLSLLMLILKMKKKSSPIQLLLLICMYALANVYDIMRYVLIPPKSFQDKYGILNTHYPRVPQDNITHILQYSYAYYLSVHTNWGERAKTKGTIIIGLLTGVMVTFTEMWLYQFIREI